MSRSLRHIIAGIAWVIGSLVAWSIACNAFGFVVFQYLGNERQMKLPEGIDTVYNCTAIAGVLIIPSITAILAIRAYLPGTGVRGSRLRGFPIEESRTHDPVGNP